MTSHIHSNPCAGWSGTASATNTVPACAAPMIISKEIRKVWRQLSRRNGWQLISDEDAFLALVAERLDRLIDRQPTPANIRIAIYQAYSVQLYDGLQARQDQAAMDLLHIMIRTTMTRGWSKQEAEEIAQEAIVRILQHLATVRSPHSFLSWALMVAHTVRRDYSRSWGMNALPVDDPSIVNSIVDSIDSAALLLERQTDAAVQQVLRVTLPNDLEYTVLLRVVLWQDHPRDVARDLGLPLHHTRLAKHRALKRLQAQPAVWQLLRSLAE